MLSFKMFYSVIFLVVNIYGNNCKSDNDSYVCWRKGLIIPIYFNVVVFLFVCLFVFVF